MTSRPVGWRREPARHALAARGVRTNLGEPRFRSVTVEIPADTQDFMAIGYKGGLNDEPIEWIRDWFSKLGHEPTDEDYDAYGEHILEHILTDSDGSELEEYLSHLESSPQYTSAKNAWAEGYGLGIRKQIENDRKINPNFPRPSNAEIAKDKKTHDAVHGEWTRIMRNAEKQAQLLIREGKPPVVSLTGEPMTYDPKRRAFIGSKYGTVLKVE